MQLHADQRWQGSNVLSPRRTIRLRGVQKFLLALHALCNTQSVLLSIMNDQQLQLQHLHSCWDGL